MYYQLVMDIWGHNYPDEAFLFVFSFFATCYYVSSVVKLLLTSENLKNVKMIERGALRTIKMSQSSTEYIAGHGGLDL